MTFSLAARCADTGHFGVVIASSSPAVAARCAHVRAGVGAVCSQNLTDPRLGTRLLDLMDGGASAREAIESVVAGTPSIAFRQLSAVDRSGAGATFSGDRCLGLVRQETGVDCAAAGNLLGNAGVPSRMAEQFAALAGRSLGDRLMAGLTAGLEAGGEDGPVHSAGLVIVDELSWPTTDLRVDWSDDPVVDLGRLWRLWRPQLEAYRVRALDPASAPSFYSSSRGNRSGP